MVIIEKGTKNMKKGIKKELDEIYGVTDEDIDKIVLGQRIEEEEEKIKILKELAKYKSFEDYVKDHEKEFEKVEISDDFKMIMIAEDIYPGIDLDILKKIGIIVDHFGIMVYIGSSQEATIHKFTKNSD